MEERTKLSELTPVNISIQMPGDYRQKRQGNFHLVSIRIDEAWAVFDGFEVLYGKGQMVKFAYNLKGEIKETLGFTVNIGMSTNFLLSKMAGDFSKPDKVHTLFPEEVEKWCLFTLLLLNLPTRINRCSFFPQRM